LPLAIALCWGYYPLPFALQKPLPHAIVLAIAISHNQTKKRETALQAPIDSTLNSTQQAKPNHII
jgi:hypothetical protein